MNENSLRRVSATQYPKSVSPWVEHLAMRPYLAVAAAAVLGALIGTVAGGRQKLR
jgi:hypothetical protein